MNRKRRNWPTVFTFAIVLVLLPLAGAEETGPERLTLLRGSYDREVQRAVSPITKKYLAALQSLQQHYTKAGDLEAAVAVEKEISRVEGTDAATVEKEFRSFLTSSEFVLRWGPSKDKRISFLPDGAIGMGQNDWEHSWKIEKGELHIVKMGGTSSWVFTYDHLKRTLKHSSTPHELDEERASLRVSN